jgi:hypothetical protein
LRRGVHHHVACSILPRLQVTFFALLEDFYPGRLAVKDRDKTPRITGVIPLSCGIRAVGRALFRLFVGRSDRSDRWTWPDPIGTGRWGTVTVCPWARHRPRPGIEAAAPEIEDQIASLQVPDRCGLKKKENPALLEGP